MGRRFAPLNWIQVVTLLLIPCLALSSAVLWLRISNEQKHQNDALRTVICLAEGFAEKSKHTSAAQRTQAIRFYNEALERAHIQSCDH